MIVIGTLVGLEIPLLMRIMKEQLQFKDLVSRVLTFDYLGSLFASLLFPIVLVPHLGLVRTSLVFGLINALVGLWSTWLLAPILGGVTRLRIKAVFVSVLLLIGIALADHMTSLFEEQLYNDEVVHAQQTPYQRIVVTRSHRGFSLFLNGNLQFSSIDEYRYHEALVHPAFQAAAKREQMLILGGGDGLAAREVLRYGDEVKRVTLVDLDGAMTRLAVQATELVELNGHSLENPRLRVINDDAMQWLANTGEKFDVVVVDFPDPNNFSLGKLYTTRFYALLKAHLEPGAVAVIQSTSPLFARRSYWCIDTTLRAAGFVTQPYHVWVPSFGEWGYVLASVGAVQVQHPLPEGLRFLSRRHHAHALPVPEGHGRGAGRGEPAQQPGAGSLLRRRVASLELSHSDSSPSSSQAIASARVHNREFCFVPKDLKDVALQASRGHAVVQFSFDDQATTHQMQRSAETEQGCNFGLAAASFRDCEMGQLVLHACCHCHAVILPCVGP